MPADPRLRRWAGEATAAGCATPLEVARFVWQHHRAEIEAAGDLLYTWQLDLRDVTEATTGRAPRPAWSTEEIAVAVDAYLTLLRAEHDGEPVRRVAVLEDALARTGHDRDALDRLFANISAVLIERGVEPLASAPPRSNVPVGLRPAVVAALARG